MSLGTPNRMIGEWTKMNGKPVFISGKKSRRTRIPAQMSTPYLDHLVQTDSEESLSIVSPYTVSLPQKRHSAARDIVKLVLCQFWRERDIPGILLGSVRPYLSLPTYMRDDGVHHCPVTFADIQQSF